MKITTAKIVCFSPTGTTRRVLQSLAEGLQLPSVQWIDGTTPNAREKSMECDVSDLLVAGVPVYMGRVPAIAAEWLKTIKARKCPAVAVVVYGNRVYDNALLELKDILSSCGAVPIAGGAYIGEHSFSTLERPTAHGRPDRDDQLHALAFGKTIRAKLESIVSGSDMQEVRVPGSFPYEGLTKLWDVDFIKVNNQCSKCGLCAKNCPTGAIDAADSSRIDLARCVTCCACIKNCPAQARCMKFGPVMDASKRLNNLFQDPRQPENYL